KEGDAQGAESTAPPRPASETSDSRFSNDLASNAQRPSKLSKRETRKTDLVEQYGESRTNLSKNVSEKVVSLLDDAIKMGEMAASGESQFGQSRWALRGVERGTGISLSEEQREQVSELYKEFQNRQLEKTKEAVESLKSDPTQLMGMMLASDALSRGEITEAEYAEIQAANSEALADVVNPLDRNNFRSNPLDDETFRNDFQQILNEEQSETFTAKVDDGSVGSNDRGPTNITEMPTMDLETMDQAVGSAKQLTSGVLQMMEGMGGLQNLQPLLENPTGSN
ncbi:MAG: hypothetical protein ACQKBU_08685, partial [Verrucomicrobiales bacterium]